jgi:hypothetical protein
MIPGMPVERSSPAPAIDDVLQLPHIACPVVTAQWKKPIQCKSKILIRDLPA